MEKEIKLHTLKIKYEYYKEIVLGNKKFELRKNNRDYQVGDLIHFVKVREKRVWTSSGLLYDYRADKIATREIEEDFEVDPNNLYKITYVLKDCPEYGLQDGYCILAIERLLI